MDRFETGKTYETRSLCDYDCIFSYTVIARTAARLTLKDKSGKTSVRGIMTVEGEEFCYPDGRYSMAPTIKATRERV